MCVSLCMCVYTLRHRVKVQKHLSTHIYPPCEIVVANVLSITSVGSHILLESGLLIKCKEKENQKK
uniref:Uncharacterized protein n=1 Tax=Octopus bimaculoides TaxID=37653 RepID=A0A0L8GWL5_OCTBM